MASGNDITSARATYDSFIGVIKVSTPIIVVIAAFVIYLLAH